MALGRPTRSRSRRDGYQLTRPGARSGASPRGRARSRVARVRHALPGGAPGESGGGRGARLAPQSILDLLPTLPPPGRLLLPATADLRVVADLRGFQTARSR